MPCQLCGSLFWAKLLLLATVQLLAADVARVPVGIVNEIDTQTCPSAEALTKAKKEMRHNAVPHLPSPCKEPDWTRIAYLDMRNSSHSCPEELTFKSQSGLRLCGRGGGNPGCWSATFN